MALTLNTINKVNPVHSSLELVATDTAAHSATVYIFKVYVEGVLEATINQQVNPQLKGELNLSSILENYFQSKVYMNSSAVCEVVPNAVVKYRVDVTAITTASTGDLYCFNGVVQDFEDFNINNYLMVSTTSKGKFLTKQIGPKKISQESKSYLSVLTGNFGLAANPSFTGISVTIKQQNGSTRTASSTYTGTAPVMLSVDVSPSRINALGGGQIDSNTLYYDVTERSGKGYPVRYYIEREQKVKDTYNILFTNSLGAVEHFDFTKVSTENLSIERSIFEQQHIRKPYNIDVGQQISVISDWMSELQSQALRDLWYSPAVKLYRASKTNDIIIKNTGVTVQNRFNNKLISYTINFEYSAPYKIQK